MARSAHNTFRVPAPTDVQLTRLFEQLLEPYEEARFNVIIAGAQVGAFRTYNEFISKYPASKSSGAKQISQISCTITHHYIQFDRSTTTGPV